MNYTFETSGDITLVYGTSKILNIADGFSNVEGTKIRGQLLTLFGEPIETSPNFENAYTYVIIATDTNGAKHILSVYHGPTGPAIGGKTGSENVAIALREYIKQTSASDFEYEGYYLDGPSKIKQSIKNGIINFSETRMSDEEYEEAMKLLFPNL